MWNLGVQTHFKKFNNLERKKKVVTSDHSEFSAVDFCYLKTCFQILSSMLLIDWMIGKLLVSRSLGLWDRKLLEVFHHWLSPVLFFFNEKYDGEYGSLPIYFPHLHAIDLLAVHLPSRTISHPKDKKLPWNLPIYPLSEKAIITQ